MQLAVGDRLELRWEAGDNEYYPASVKELTAESATFVYAASSEWDAFEEEVDLANLGGDPPRVRATRRRSGREKKLMLGSYKDLEEGLIVRRKDTAEFAAMLKSDGVFELDTVPRIAGEELTAARLRATGFTEPWVVKPVACIDGMKMPPTLTVQRVAELVGEDCLMPVLDVGPQSEVTMTLGSWAEYWRAPYRQQRLNVTSLEVTGTPLAGLVESPAAVRAVDWIDNVWPTELKRRSLEGVTRRCRHCQSADTPLCCPSETHSSNWEGAAADQHSRQ